MYHRMETGTRDIINQDFLEIFYEVSDVFLSESSHTKLVSMWKAFSFVSCDTHSEISLSSSSMVTSNFPFFIWAFLSHSVAFIALDRPKVVGFGP
mmetsp:Transcript_6327/g.15284  ORF Transcript_6327/g.15284 Transcript_6327/m.15284 type:complete len:95 (-) Transcript_6327:942-1226(-)